MGMSQPKPEFLGPVEETEDLYKVAMSLGLSKFVITDAKWPIEVVSTGFLVDEETALMWRGLMLTKAVEQFLNDVHWGDLDYLVIDLPPGTGDVPLSLAQALPLTGSVVVCTPQDVALLDAVKAERDRATNSARSASH